MTPPARGTFQRPRTRILKATAKQTADPVPAKQEQHEVTGPFGGRRPLPRGGEGSGPGTSRWSRPRRHPGLCRAERRRGTCRRGRARGARRGRSGSPAGCRALLSSSQRRRARSSADAARKTLTSASGKTTVPMSRPSMTILRPWAKRRAAALTKSRTSPFSAKGRTAAVTAGVRMASETSSPAKRHAAGGAADVDARENRANGRRIGGIDAGADCGEGHGAVDGAGVEVLEAESLCEVSGSGGLAAGNGSVNRHDHARFRNPGDELGGADYSLGGTDGQRGGAG